MQLYTVTGDTIRPGIAVPAGAPPVLVLGQPGPWGPAVTLPVAIPLPPDGVLRVAGVAPAQAGHGWRLIAAAADEPPTALVLLRLPAGRLGRERCVSGPLPETLPCRYQGRHLAGGTCPLCATPLRAGVHPRAGGFTRYPPLAGLPGVLLLGRGWRPPPGVPAPGLAEVLVRLDPGAQLRLLLAAPPRRFPAALLTWTGQTLQVARTFG